MIEVVVPYEREEVGWEARIFPWDMCLPPPRARRVVDNASPSCAG